MTGRPGALRLFAPAKVNLYLRVTGRREDGYHLLDTLMAPISLGDEVEVSRADGPPGSTTVRADHPDVPPGPGNTVYRAALAFRERTGRQDPVAVELRKRIPVGAGLGGGSTDAAAALRGMNRLLGAGLSDDDLLDLAASVGADAPFFVRGGAARAGGIGERLAPAGPLPKLWMVVLFPNFPVSTAWVYRNYPLKLTKPSDNNNLSGNLDTPREVARVMVNDLETVTIGRYPRIARLKGRLDERGALGSLMSGSGSAVFGLFADEAEARTAFAGLEGEKDVRAHLVFSLT